MENRKLIQENIKNTLTETNVFDSQKIHSGKVRDLYENNENLIIITTDRQTAFDRTVGSIPFKGAVLNLLTSYWFEQTKDIVPNHMISTPDANTLISEKLEMIPLEIVVRGYLTGSTETSIWTKYKNGERQFGGITLPEDLKKNEKLPQNLITPTTKAKKGHDMPINEEEILKQEIVTPEEWNQIKEYALKLFERGQKLALEKGFILVDTKYEFGKNSKGEIILADEIHTPDCSRYWIAETYQTRLNLGDEPENFDKEFFRLWFIENSDPYNDTKLPEAPIELITELSVRYINVYERLTEKEFPYPETSNINDRIHNNLNQYFSQKEVMGNN